MKKALISGKIVESPVHRWTGMNTVSEILVPVLFQGEPVGVVAMETNLAFQVGEIGGEGWFRSVAHRLYEMMAIGEFPYKVTSAVSNHSNPRVADGVSLLDIGGRVEHASPNTVSAFKRLGFSRPLYGEVLAEVATPLVATGSTMDETLAIVLMGCASWVAEVEVRDMSVTIRALPLRRNGKRTRALLLARDVTEKRVREKQLLSKDVTVRKVHHRIKNSLQTVSTVLRLQARCSDNDTVKEALAEAKRCVSAIATAHGPLSQTVDESVAPDEAFGKLLALIATTTSEDHFVETKLTNSFSTPGADVATALGVVLSELVTNAARCELKRHSGTVTINTKRSEDELVVTVADDDVGTDQESIGGGLGIQIVKTLVNTGLGGPVRWERRVAPDVGTIVHLVATRL